MAWRENALLRCVRSYVPFGLLGTFAYLDRRAGDLDPSDRLIAAINLLDHSRGAWRAELARFAEARRRGQGAGPASNHPGGTGTVCQFRLAGRGQRSDSWPRPGPDVPTHLMACCCGHPSR